MKKAEIGPRIGALIIDGLISIPLAFVAAIPFVGIIGGLLAIAYWLCRDLLRPSLGKKALKLDVVDINGGRPTDQQLILRNIPFAIPSLISMIPFLGIVAGPALATLVFVGELVMFITQGQRIGDKIANTQVVAIG
jgi:uncharacterized RDD family membrane protein YckC